MRISLSSRPSWRYLTFKLKLVAERKHAKAKFQSVLLTDRWRSDVTSHVCRVDGMQSSELLCVDTAAAADCGDHIEDWLVLPPAAAGADHRLRLLDSKAAAATHYPSPLYGFSSVRTLQTGCDDQSEGLNGNCWMIAQCWRHPLRDWMPGLVLSWKS